MSGVGVFSSAHSPTFTNSSAMQHQQIVSLSMWPPPQPSIQLIGEQAPLIQPQANKVIDQSTDATIEEESFSPRPFCCIAFTGIALALGARMDELDTIRNSAGGRICVGGMVVRLSASRRRRRLVTFFRSNNLEWCPLFSSAVAVGVRQNNFLRCPSSLHLHYSKDNILIREFVFP